MQRAPPTSPVVPKLSAHGAQASWRGEADRKPRARDCISARGDRLSARTAGRRGAERAPCRAPVGRGGARDGARAARSRLLRRTPLIGSPRRRRRFSRAPCSAPRPRWPPRRPPCTAHGRAARQPGRPFPPVPLSRRARRLRRLRRLRRSRRLSDRVALRCSPSCWVRASGLVRGCRAPRTPPALPETPSRAHALPRRQLPRQSSVARAAA